MLVLKVPKKGEIHSGDGYFVLAEDDGTLIVVLDALGHGPAAADVVAIALPVIERSAGLPMQDLFRLLEERLAGTRGAVVGAVRITPNNETVTWAGIGDIQGVIVAGDSRRSLVGRPGIVGYHSPMVRDSVHRFDLQCTLCLASDGVAPEYAMQVNSLLTLEGNARRLEPLLRPNQDDSLLLLAQLRAEPSAE